jgi:outer membrane receptor protein involved in Fe transport
MGIFNVDFIKASRLLALGFVFGAAPIPATAEDAASSNTELTEIVVTAVARPINRLDSSISTSSVDFSAIAQVAPRSTEELFRSLPGIRSESSGGEGNANITVRGIPLATGGSKYLQLMEDGLPVLEYGDLNFANADNFIRYDWSVQRIESIRGGSASTFASDSPGGVINFISNTGEKEGGAVGASFGADYRETRADFAYGGHLTDTIRFHVGGYYRTGEGVRHTGFNGQNGGQIKLNITKEFDGGYLRFFAKHLDDRVSTYLPSPVMVKNSGKFGPVPGYDASTDSTYSQYQTQVNTFDAYGNRVNRDLTDGIHAKVESFGFEFDKDAGNGWHINDKVRNSTVSGGFISPFTDTFGIGIKSAQAWGDALCAGSKDAAGAAATGCTGTTVTYAQGPNGPSGSTPGKAYSGLAWTNLLFDTTFRDVGLFVNDLKISKDLGPVTATVGYYSARQKIAIDWNSWQFLIESVNKNPIPLNVVSSTGQIIAQDGLYWPALLSWSWDLNYDTSSPYINFGGAIDKFTWDASARFDHVRARGTLFNPCCGNAGGFDYNRDGKIDVYEARGAAFVTGGNPNGRVNYSASHTEFSLGGAYRLTDDSSVFGRYSNGARFSADRLLQIAGALNADGSLTSSTKGYDLVKQIEFGYKLHRNAYSLYATLFHTKTDETNADLTTGETFLRAYKAYGLELEGNWQLPMGFDVGGNVTYTHAKIDSDAINPAVVGERPRRQANLIWTVTPQYRGANFGAGLTFQGSSDYFLANPNRQPNSLKQGAYTLINLFGYYNLSDALSLSVNVNNLTDEFVVTEAEESTGVAGDIVRARPLNGRSTMISLRYTF